MNLSSFKDALASFADDRKDLDLTQGQLLVQIRDEMIEASITEEKGDIFVIENNVKKRGFDWLVKRVAKVPQLAHRIIDHVAQEPHFVIPAGKVLDHLEDGGENDRSVADVPSEIINLLSKTPAGTASVLYITSDAGEGKTTVIDQVARIQAKNYQLKKTNWLLVPMRLGGRSFLTFDDVVVAELVNRFRFQFFYYDAFLELVRLGVLIPAFDGFEEIFVEGSTGEAISSLGNLVRSMNSSGAVVMAVRKAHFEYHSFSDQARAFNALSDVDASFARISLDRWDKTRFLKYGHLRKLSNTEGVYNAVRNRLHSDNHPVLTRAVLAKRLVDVAQKKELSKLLEQIGTAVGDYFFHFVNAIIEREVQEKWIDRSGVPHQALLTIDEHHVLLRMVAKEMWITSSDSLGEGYIDLVAELFTEEFSKPASIARQIVIRLRQHALIAVNRTSPLSYSFDHDDFRMFYWGEEIAEMFLRAQDSSELGIYLGKRALPDVSADAGVAAMERKKTDLIAVLDLLGRLVLQGSSVSYVTENAAALAVRILDVLTDAKGVTLCGFHFAADAMKGRRISKVTFENCSFARMSLEGTTLEDMRFSHCAFDEIEVASELDVSRTEFRECSIGCVRGSGGVIYDPGRILKTLKDIGFLVDKELDLKGPVAEPDDLVLLADRALRTFLRATAVNETTLKKRLGVKAQKFFGDVLPLMLEKGVLKEVEYTGKGHQRRFRLAMSMIGIRDALSKGKSLSLAEFLEAMAVKGG